MNGPRNQRDPVRFESRPRKIFLHSVDTLRRAHHCSISVLSGGSARRMTQLRQSTTPAFLCPRSSGVTLLVRTQSPPLWFTTPDLEHLQLA